MRGRAAGEAGAQRAGRSARCRPGGRPSDCRCRRAAAPPQRVVLVDVAHQFGSDLHDAVRRRGRLERAGASRRRRRIWRCLQRSASARSAASGQGRADLRSGHGPSVDRGSAARRAPPAGWHRDRRRVPSCADMPAPDGAGPSRTTRRRFGATRRTASARGATQRSKKRGKCGVGSGPTISRQVHAIADLAQGRGHPAAVLQRRAGCGTGRRCRDGRRSPPSALGQAAARRAGPRRRWRDRRTAAAGCCRSMPAALRNGVVELAALPAIAGGALGRGDALEALRLSSQPASRTLTPALPAGRPPDHRKRGRRKGRRHRAAMALSAFVMQPSARVRRRT